MQRRSKVLILGSLLGAALGVGVIGAVFGAGQNQVPGAETPALAMEPLAPGTKLVRPSDEQGAGQSPAPLDATPFIGCEARALRTLRERVVSELEAFRTVAREPTRPIVSVPRGRYPMDTDDAEYVGSEPTPLLLLPSPDTARRALGAHLAEPAPDATTLADQAEMVAESAITIFFNKPLFAKKALLWVPTPIGHPITTGVLKYSRPWLEMERIVVTRASPVSPDPLDSDATLLERATEAAREAGVTTDAALWTIPLNDYVVEAVLAADDGVRSWIAYPIADGVAGRRGGSSHTTPTGESALSVPFTCDKHDPRGPRGYPLLRIPAANQRSEDSRLLPGERITLDEWFASPERGFAILLLTEAAAPGLPEYRITTDIATLADPANRERVQLVCIFESISDELLERVVRAYLLGE